MAEILIEKTKRGFPWWGWLIMVALVVGLLFWLFANRDQGDSTSRPSTIAASNYDPEARVDKGPAGTITDMATLVNSPATAVIGREVRLTNVPAGAVPADAGFWITGPAGKREYVILHEVLTPDTPIEGRIDVDEGDRLDITGVVRAAAEGVPKDAAIPGPTAPLPPGVEHYIDSRSVTKSR